jgi:hypothetical protein
VHSCLVAEVKCKVSNKMYQLCNVNGTYTDLELFWENLLENKSLLSKNTIIGGDLKFSMGRGEIWGVLVREDPLSQFFRDKMESMGLVDMESSQLSPTWTNNRSVSVVVHEHIDHFLVHQSLLQTIGVYKYWVGKGKC